MSIKLTTKQVRYLWLIGGILILLIGLVSMALPFLPLGYVFTLGGLIILSSRIPFLQKLLRKLERKDKKGRVKRLNKKVVETERIVERKVTARKVDQYPEKDQKKTR